MALVIESGFWASLRRDVASDIRSGADLRLVDYAGHAGAVALYVDSPAGRHYRSRKSRVPTGVQLFELPLLLDDVHRVGPIRLYRPQDVQRLWKQWQGHDWSASPRALVPAPT